MKRTIFLSTLFLLVACGPSNEDKQNVATITCNIIAETKNMDPAMKIKEMNNAREKINGEPYLFGKDKINESLKYNLCQNLVLLSESEYEEVLLTTKEEVELQKRSLDYQERRKEIKQEVKEIKEYFIDVSEGTETFCEGMISIFGDLEYFVRGSTILQNWENKDYEEIIDSYNENNIGQKCDFSLEDAISSYRETLSE